MKRFFGTLACVVFLAGFAAPVHGGNPPSFKKIMIVVFENVDYADALAQSGLADFARKGGLLTNFHAAVHPSQGNYIAMTAGDTYGVLSDEDVNLNARHVGDLLEARGKSWKIYLEGYPGGCFKGTQQGHYVRKHNPFMSFLDIQNDSKRCAAHMADSSQLANDIRDGNVPDYSIYTPDIDNDGHDTGVGYADQWFKRVFGPLLKDPRFMQDMVVVATFDESSMFGGNHIYTAFYGDSVLPGSKSAGAYTHYSLLRLVEDVFGLGDLGKKDAAAEPIRGIWK